MNTATQGVRSDPAPGPPRIPWSEPIDGFRAICACLAVIGHLFLASSIMPFDGVMLVLGILVALFFAISSFVLYQPFILADVTHRPRPRSVSFYVRRLFRIYPLFFLATLTYLVLIPAVRADNWWATGRLFLFLQIYGEELNDLKGLPSAWYLCNEVVFYLMMPVMAWSAARWSNRRGRTTVRDRLRPHLAIGWALIIIGPITRTLLYVFDVPYPPVLPPSHLEFLGLGIIVAAHAVGVRNGVRPPAPIRWVRANTSTTYILFLVPVLILVMLAQSAGDGTGAWGIGDIQDHARFPIYLVAIALLMVPAAFGPSTNPTNRFLGARRFKFLSSLALHIYLWHQLVLAMMNKALGGLDRVDLGGRFLTGTVLCAVAIALTVLLSWVTLPVTEFLYQRYRRRHGRTAEGSKVGSGAVGRMPLMPTAVRTES